MNLYRLLQAKPDKAAERWLLILTVLLVTALSYLHLHTGPAYEFHLFFILPVLPVTWYVSPRRGALVSLLTVTLWFLADRQLGGLLGPPLPLVFNSAVRLGSLLMVVWLLGLIRAALDRETRLANEDNLTTLANRRGFFDTGRSLFHLIRRERIPVTAVFIDLDRFKEINDSLGHTTGDALLQTVAQEIRRHLRESDVAGRLGGDEFALLLPGCDPEAAADYAEKLRQRLLAAMREHRWPVTFSIGVAGFTSPPETFESLVDEADMLMYEVKESGRDRVLVRRFPET